MVEYMGYAAKLLVLETNDLEKNISQKIMGR